jgi:hypothetical protein
MRATPSGSPHCVCNTYCGDTPEENDHPLAVCKSLPDPPKPPLLEVALIHKDDFVRPE